MNKDINPADDALASEEEMGPPSNPAADAPGLPQLPRLQPVVENSARKRAIRKVVTTLNLTSRTCKWPIGDPTQPDFHYCGQPPQAGRPYCATHDDMSYQPQRRRSAGR